MTDAIVAEVTAWQSRPLESLYSVVFFDALRVKIRDEAVVRSKAAYLALAVLPDGTRDLGIWIEQTEGAKLWMKVFSDLKTRGCQDILIAVSDGETVDHASHTKFLTLPEHYAAPSQRDRELGSDQGPRTTKDQERPRTKNDQGPRTDQEQRTKY